MTPGSSTVVLPEYLLSTQASITDTSTDSDTPELVAAFAAALAKRSAAGDSGSLSRQPRAKSTNRRTSNPAFALLENANVDGVCSSPRGAVPTACCKSLTTTCFE